VAKKSEPYKVGDHIQISLNNRIIDAVVRAVVEQTDGIRLQVDLGNEQTALIHEWQVVKGKPL
jgi:ribosomal 50S subunit-recycling heat shock protein